MPNHKLNGTITRTNKILTELALKSK